VADDEIGGHQLWITTDNVETRRATSRFAEVLATNATPLDH
jgi:hypothetical protein